MRVLTYAVDVVLQIINPPLNENVILKKCIFGNFFFKGVIFVVVFNAFSQSSLIS